MNLQPTLTGATLTLIPLAPEHREPLTQAAGDPLIWELHPEPTRYLPEVFAGVFNSGIESGGALLITDRQTGEVLGTSRYYDFDEINRAIAIGYSFLVRSRWGGVTNTELKTLMLEHAFSAVDTVWFHVGADNLRSRRAVEKLGAELSHIEQESPTGVVRATVFYKLTKSHWQSQRD